MHMADALVSPAVGGVLWAASGGLAACSVGRLRRRGGEGAAVPFMGVLGAFVFSAQMVNVAVPGTGSSVHLVGGLLLAVLLGPHEGFLAMACVLAVQALLFADGGILAFGCNLFNMGAVPCFMVCPLLYRPLARRGGPPWITLAGVLSGIAALGAGALGVAAETVVSGRADLPFLPFLGLMEGVHLPLGVVEGVLTAGVVSFLVRAQSHPMEREGRIPVTGARGWGALPAGLLLAAFLTAGVLSGFASDRPDGLEWSLARLAGPETGARGPGQEGEPLHRALAAFQEKTALLPGYTAAGEPAGEVASPVGADGREVGSGTAHPDLPLSLPGVLGSGLVLFLVSLAAWLLHPRDGVP